MAESGFKPGDKVRVVRLRENLPFGMVDVLTIGSDYVVEGRTLVGDGWKVRSSYGALWGYDWQFELVTDAPAAAPAEPAKERPPLGSPPYDNARIYDQDRQVRQWDSDKYTGLGDWTPLDQRIAAVKTEHTRSAESAGLLHPRDYWSNKLRGGRRRG